MEERMFDQLQESSPFVVKLGLRTSPEVSWIQSGAFFSNFSLNSSLNILLNRNALPRFSFKGTSDFVQQPISKQGLNGIWDLLFQGPPVAATLQITPWGGRMYEISESATPFPHRRGNLYMVNMGITLEANETERVEWLRNLYKYMAPYVSKFPRVAYVNYNYLDFGVNGEDTTSYAQANQWARKYFKNNFDRLVRVQAVVDPDNFFSTSKVFPLLPNG